MIALLNEHPKTAKVIREYYLTKMIESLKDDDLPENFKKHMKQQGIKDEQVAKMIGNSPSLLFPIFDENEIYINVSPEYNGSLVLFCFDTGHGEINTFITRKEAEIAGVTKAFKILENILK